MSHPSISTTEAEPPYGEQPVSPEDDVTLDLEEPGSADMMLADEAPGEASAGEETLDLRDLAGETLVGCELQEGKYRVLALRPGALAGLSLVGVSYTALHTDLQKRLTLRYLPLDLDASAEEREETTAQFLREVRVLAKLDHPSLPRVHDYFCEGAACYVVMDEVSERTLADALADAAQEGRVPALPPVMIAQLGLELVRALGYLHQQRPPLALGGLRPEDIALPADGPAQLMSLSALSMVASLSSVSLPGLTSLPTLGGPEPITKITTMDDLPTAPASPCPGDDLYSLGVLLRELAGGAEVVERVMDRLRRPDEVLQADDAGDAPPISLTLAGVIQIAAHDEPGRRFQQAAAMETALMRAWVIERRIVRQAEQSRGDGGAARLESEEEDLAATALELEAPEAEAARQHEKLATRHFWLESAVSAGSRTATCWRCGGHNTPGARLCRVCGARQPTLADQRGRGYPSEPRRRARPTRRLDESGWAAWGEDEMEAAPTRPRRSRPAPGRQATAEARTLAPLRRPTAPPREQPDHGRRLLWGLVWACFVMAFLLGGATLVVTYLALR
ncbi:MAG TPA: hypothetical protein VH599_09815 [Ktedonobacterales bacterium]|jgi:ribosomal protein L40E